MRRPGCRRFQSHTDPDPQACVVDRDQSPPWKSRSRRSHLLPHVAALLLHNGFTTAHSFHIPVFTSRCYSLLTPRQTRQAMSSIRLGTEGGSPNRPPGLLPMRPIRTWPKPCMRNRLRGNPVHNATIYRLSWQHPRRVTEKPRLAGGCRCHEGCTPHGRHEAPAAAPPESVHLPICPWTLVGTP